MGVVVDDDEVGEGEDADAGGSSLGDAELAPSDEHATTTLATNASAIHLTTRAEITCAERATLVPLSCEIDVAK